MVLGPTVGRFFIATLIAGLVAMCAWAWQSIAAPVDVTGSGSRQEH